MLKMNLKIIIDNYDVIKMRFKNDLSKTNLTVISSLLTGIKNCFVNSSIMGSQEISVKSKITI